MKIKYVVGIDISKDKFDVAFVLSQLDKTPKVIASRKFDNSKKGHLEFKDWCLKKQKEDLPVEFVMEATGVYHEKLAWFLSDNEVPVSIVLPNRAKAYMKSLGIKTKNDKVDAKGLAFMGACQSLAKWKPISKAFYTLRELTRFLEDLQKDRTSMVSRLKGLKHKAIVSEKVMEGLKAVIEGLDEQIRICEQEIALAVAKDPELKKRIGHMMSIKGVGLLTAVTVAAETNGFALIENERQLVSYAGYDVRQNQSGSREGKTSITKKGNAHIRRIMFMAAFNMVTYEQGQFKPFYERIHNRTKQSMKGYVAVQSKLLRIMYALWKNETDFDNNYGLRDKSNQSKNQLKTVVAA
ncbi:IS110 family transposase [Persicobacter diffluens]|uniref:IS110 family transposase n=1 Tax=Persicobacter diffluens TaxID=981 RepID=A0AAN4W045_9BACT|nr:IS110 family transposase [Persicobacter diffluens]GJM61835.1 IS110 family transposase [Persicobacter diffluens]GJM63269.1 IS110 family transposase [Persicobacter diffluens]GJM63429.1 IS110 family transposase [Persicobacter diffluens]